MIYDMNRGRSRKSLPVRLWQAVIRIKTGIIIAIIILAIISSAYLIRSCRGNTLNAYVNDKIDITPTQVTAMIEIGEWEFLSIEDEELVDTVRKSWFGNDELIRIYFGTLRLGFDMSDTGKDWIKKDRDTLNVTLPAIGLLDDDFIDEARTQSFFESGRWTDKDRANMYRRAYSKMKSRCLTKENIKTAEKNAEMQFRKMLNSLGFEHIKIKFDRKELRVKSEE